jgi:hypothetical protein
MNGKRDEQIRSRAYKIWEREGRPQGRQEHHWHQAIREVDEGAGDQAPEAPAASALVGKAGAAAKRTPAPKPPAEPKTPTKPKAAAKPKATAKPKP